MHTFTKEDVRLATQQEKPEILEFYRSVIGVEGCTWDEHYPNRETIDRDISENGLFEMRDEKGIVGLVSIDDDPCVEELTCWRTANAREIARLGVRRDMHNRGIARVLLGFMLEELKRRDYEGAHFLVSIHNKKALASYEKLSFTNQGTTELFGETWYCYEKQL